MFPIAPHFFIPYSLPLSSILENLYIQPKGGDCNISILGLSKAWFFFLVMSQSKMLNTPKKNKKIIFLKKKKKEKAFRLPTTR